MPIQSNLGHHAFRPEQIDRMKQAFDQAWSEIAPSSPVSPKSARDAIALGVIRRAAAGVEDAEALVEAGRAAARFIQTKC